MRKELVGIPPPRKKYLLSYPWNDRFGLNCSRTWAVEIWVLGVFHFLFKAENWPTKAAISNFFFSTAHEFTAHLLVKLQEFLSSFKKMA